MLEMFTDSAENHVDVLCEVITGVQWFHYDIADTNVQWLDEEGIVIRPDRQLEVCAATKLLLLKRAPTIGQQIGTFVARYAAADTEEMIHEIGEELGNRLATLFG